MAGMLDSIGLAVLRTGVWGKEEKPGSKELITGAESSFARLRHKEFEWRSYYNGFLEGFAWLARRGGKGESP